MERQCQAGFPGVAMWQPPLAARTCVSGERRHMAIKTLELHTATQPQILYILILFPKLTSHTCAPQVCSPPSAIAVIPFLKHRYVKLLGILSFWHAVINEYCRNGIPPLGDSRTMMMVMMMMMKTDTNRLELGLGFIPEYPFDLYTGLPYVWSTGNNHIH